MTNNFTQLMTKTMSSFTFIGVNTSLWVFQVVWFFVPFHLNRNTIVSEIFNPDRMSFSDLIISIQRGTYI